MDLDKKFISEIIKFWGFMADIDPKINFFGMHDKFPKIIRLRKKIIFFDEYLRKKVQKTFFTFFDHNGLGINSGTYVKIKNFKN
jgi:hypothetical protein